ncbi:MAG TPA: hypothetical protein VLI54_06545 [Bacillota bacterium]|nr:hypothetical protein [Bacillota bacterium]
MATKQEKITERAVARAEKKGKVREEKHVLWFLIAIILLLLWLLFAQHNGWWPYSRPKLGTAFYTNISANTPAPASADTSGSGTGSNGSGSGSGGSSGTNGSNGSNGSNGGTTTTPPASSSLLNLAANVNVGDSKADVGAQANNLGQNCAVIVNAATNTSLGKQEVCTYTEGDKIVTVTYLNDRVISASKSGF